MSDKNKDDREQIKKRAKEALENINEPIPFAADSPEFDEIIRLGLQEYGKLVAKKKKQPPSRMEVAAELCFFNI